MIDVSYYLGQLNRNSKIVIIVIAAVFLFSLLTYQVFYNDKTRVVLFYPEKTTKEVKTEVVSLPSAGTGLDRVERMLNSLFSESVKYNLARLVPENTKLQGLVLNKGRLYINLSDEFLSDDSDRVLDYKTIFSVIRRNIRFNYGGIGKIIITVNGQLPYEPYYKEPLY